MKKFTWFAPILAACFGIGFLCSSAALAAGPQISVPEPAFNFGETSEMTPVVRDFVVKNTGDAVLNIKDVKPGCGCTITRFDRTIPPGAEGTVNLQLNVRGFQGYVKKPATIISDDPANPRLVLFMEGTVRPLIEVRPEKIIYFQGTADSFTERIIDLSATAKPFHITKVFDDLEKKASYRLETIEDGKHYRLRISNNASTGSYRGAINLYTDYPEKPELTIWVNGLIEGEIGIRPTDLVIGRLSPDQDVISGKVLVVNNRKKPFKILKCLYDEKIVSVSQEPFSNEPGYSLEVIPKMENIPPGSRVQVILAVQTDVDSEQKEVRIQAINLSGGPR